MWLAIGIAIAVACLDLLLVMASRPVEFEPIGFTTASWAATALLSFVATLALCTVVGAFGRRRGWSRTRIAVAISVFVVSAYLLGSRQELYVLAETTAQKLRQGALLQITAVAAVLAVLAFRLLTEPLIETSRHRLRFVGRSLPWLLLMGVAAWWFFLYGLAGSPAPADPTVGERSAKVILLTVDTLRQDHVVCSSADLSMTPNLCSLAEDGVVFERSYAAGPWTKPSFASIFTGVSPAVHGVVHDAGAIPAELPTMAELLGSAGLRTMGVVRNAYLSREAGYGRGFEGFVQLGKTSMQTGLNSLGAALVSSLGSYRVASSLGLRAWPPRHSQVWTPLVTSNGLDWLREHADEPFFLWLHYFDPHDPYVPPPAYMPTGQRAGKVTYYFDAMARVRNGTWVASREERDRVKALYAGEVRFVDDAVGQILAELEELGIYDETLIAFTSDHGEELWDHHGVAHGHTLYEELVRVPLIFKLPAGEERARDRVETPVSNERLLPTVLDLLAVAPPETLAFAESLRSLWSADGDAQGDQPPVYSTGLKIFEDRESVVFDGHKYIRFAVSDAEELYDLEADPTEQTSLVAQRPEVALRGRQLIDQFRQLAEATRSERGLEGEEIELDEETLRVLRALGYVD